MLSYPGDKMAHFCIISKRLKYAVLRKTQLKIHTGVS